MPNKARKEISRLARVLTPFLGGDATGASHRLVAQFGSIVQLLNAPATGIRAALPGQDDIADKILAARELTRMGWAASLDGPEVCIDSLELQTYLMVQLQRSREERVHAIFMDGVGRYLQDELLTQGGRDRVIFDPKQLVRRAFDLDAGKIILSHNHPSGSWQPSAKDQRTTARLHDLLGQLSIELTDHLIVAKGKIFSMRRGALL